MLPLHTYGGCCSQDRCLLPRSCSEAMEHCGKTRAVVAADLMPWICRLCSSQKYPLWLMRLPLLLQPTAWHSFSPCSVTVPICAGQGTSSSASPQPDLWRKFI